MIQEMITKHINRLYDTIRSRGYLDEDSFILSSKFIKASLKFYDGSLLEFYESWDVREGEVHRIRYSYHYQDSDEALVFRYDNAPHFRNIITYPHHKHIGGEKERVVPSSPPDLDTVLREIEQILF